VALTSEYASASDDAGPYQPDLETPQQLYDQFALDDELSSFLLVCVDVNDGGGFNVGHRELREPRQSEDEERKRKGMKRRMLLKTAVLF
jgi:hypothetical protein